ncbi:IS3 family transposase [Spirosoma luteolum]
MKTIRAQRQVSLRRVCQVVGRRRATLYAKPKRINEDKTIRDVLTVLSQKHLNWGFRLLFGRIKLSGYSWNHKRVYRIYKALELNLRSPIKRKRIKRDNPNTLAASQVNQGWSLDFLIDEVVAEKKVRILNVLDEYSRKCLLAVAQPAFKAKKLVSYLEQMVQAQGKPQYIRCDNGPELISAAMSRFADKHGIELRHTQPGKPMQNELMERLNGTIRRECLNLQVFVSIQQVQTALDEWWQQYNFERTHSSLNYQTPESIYRSVV